MRSMAKSGGDIETSERVGRTNRGTGDPREAIEGGARGSPLHLLDGW